MRPVLCTFVVFCILYSTQLCYYNIISQPPNPTWPLATQPQQPLHAAAAASKHTPRGANWRLASDWPRTEAEVGGWSQWAQLGGLFYLQTSSGIWMWVKVGCKIPTLSWASIKRLLLYSTYYNFYYYCYFIAPFTTIPVLQLLMLLLFLSMF